jgi:hypothetical protein
MEWWQYFNPLPPNFPALQVDEQAATFVPASVDTVGDIFNIVAGALANGMAIYFKVGAIPPASGPPNSLPPPIVAGTHYFVINWTPTQFQISATLNGPPLGLTGAGSGTNEIWDFASAGGNWHNRYRFRVIIDNTVIPDTEVSAIINLIQYFKPITRWPEGETLVSEPSAGSVFVFGFAEMTVTIQSAAATIRH